jgi:hypothetical protein
MVCTLPSWPCAQASTSGDEQHDTKGVWGAPYEYEQKFKRLASSCKAHFEGKMLDTNSNLEDGKKKKRMDEIAPGSTIALWDDE